MKIVKKTQARTNTQFIKGNLYEKEGILFIHTEAGLVRLPDACVSYNVEYLEVSEYRNVTNDYELREI